MVQLLRRHRQEDLNRTLGSFLFRYRNGLFVGPYFVLFLPSPPLVAGSESSPLTPLLLLSFGFAVSLAGQAVRCATIGLAYIVRGGREGRVYAEGLVTGGIFGHCRNPLYVGNILMLLGLGAMANSLLFVAVVMPLFLLVYGAIVATEEQFLRAEFGPGYAAYCQRVNRWWPRLSGLRATFASMRFNWKRWLVKEYNTLYIWLSAAVLIVMVKHPVLAGSRLFETRVSVILGGALLTLLLAYLTVRQLKKTGRLRDGSRSAPVYGPP